ncbi:MAG: cardiolipin synthase [Burkholderiales bacterium]|nr:cardiolipin synthase [Burkholderiales bacterium]
MKAPKVDGRFVFWVCVAFVLGIAVSLLVANLGTGEKKIDRKVERLHDTRDPAFARDLSLLLGPPLLEGNAAEVLVNGDRIFAAMLADIRSAKSTISFETYIYWGGTIGEEFAIALADRARAGVKVHLLLDWVGSTRLDKEALDRMKKAGVEIERFHQPHWSHLPRLNNRTHRKILVVDGQVGYTGGVGIADKWRGDAQDPEHWRDTHFRVRGPVVAQMQSVFTDNWTKATGRVLHGSRYFPAIEAVSGGMPAQMFRSSPSGGAESMHLMYLLAVTAAKTSIELSNSYFVPDELTIHALAAAARRGVKVRIIVPGPIIDSSVVRAASRADWGPLLEAGVQIAEYQKTMFHCKVLVVDGRFVSVGSTNFDNRSFRINDEANLNLLDEKFAAEQVKVFENDLSSSKVVTLEAWRNRPKKERAMEWIGQVLKSQL